MARREVDVVIGAKTDDASFRQTEQKTKGFLSRLRGGLGGGRGGDSDQNFLERTARAQETLSKVVAIGAILKEGVAALNAGLEITKGLTAGLAGDMEAFDAAIVQAKESLGQSLAGAAGLTIGEAIFGDADDAKKVTEETQRAAQKNAKLHAETLKRLREEERARERLQKIIDEGNKRRAMDALDNLFDKEVLAAQQRLHAKLDELDAIREILKDTKAIHSLEIEAAQIKREAEEEIAEIRKRQQQFLSDQVQGLVDFFKTGRTSEPDAPGEVPFRAGLPGVTQGLLLSGQAEAARTKSSEAIRRQQAAENTEKNTGETVSVLRQLLEATRNQQYAPVLN